MLNCVLPSVLQWEVVDWIILCPPQGLSDGLIKKHTLLIEENSPTLSPEIDMDASYFPLTGCFNWNFYCDYPVLAQHYISYVLGEIVCLLHPGTYLYWRKRLCMAQRCWTLNYALKYLYLSMFYFKRFHFYLSMARPPDQETTVFEKTGCYSQIPRGEKTPVTGGHTEKL